MSDETPAPVKKYSRKLKVEPVVIENEAGIEETYTLVELTGKQRDNWLQEIQKRFRLDGNGKPIGTGDSRGLVSMLLGMSLRDPDGNLVKEEEVREWPSAMQQDLFKKSKELSGLDERAKEEAKND